MDGTFQGRLRASQVQSIGTNGDFIRLELEDETSHTRVMTVNLTLPQFGALIGTSRDVEISYELCAAYAGTRHEHKHERLFVTHHVQELANKQDKKVDEIEELISWAKDYERDGWKMSLYDLGNHHNWDSNTMTNVNWGRGNWMRVTFHRFVNPATGLPVEVER